MSRIGQKLGFPIMDSGDVWRLVAEAREAVGGLFPEADAIAQKMADLLAHREPADIIAFADALWDLVAGSYRADLWAAAYLINGGASDDGFDYFRGWLIAQGQLTFEATLADPDGLAGHPLVIQTAVDGEDLTGEDILSVAWTAHRAATGQDQPVNRNRTPYPDLDPAWDFDFDDEAEMRRRLPRLASRFYDPIGG